MIPKFFGESGRQLFSVYHPPGGTPRPAGVVLCYPGPQDYRHVHWAFRKLAGLLAREGHHVLRFDYYATGDSAGESSEGTLGQWTADVAAAARELQDISGARRVSLVGMRLGAALAARACVAGLKVKDLVLWEPVVSGRAYLAQLDAVEARRLRDAYYPVDDRHRPDEMLGYPMSASMRGDLEAVDLTRERAPAVERALVVATMERAEYGPLSERLEAAGATAAVRRVDDPALYGGTDEMGDTLLAHNVPHTIAAWLARRAQ